MLRSCWLRDRVVIWSGLVGVTALSWLYVYRQMGPTEGMTDIAMPAAFVPWTATDFALNMAIWWAMMPGMMLPSAAPMILTFCDDQPAQAPARPAFCPDDGVHVGLSDRLGSVRHLCDASRTGVSNGLP